jgi:hypothetical protein
MLFNIGDRVRSLRDKKIVGEIRGFGTLQWPGESGFQFVYLVCVEPRGSSSLGPAFKVLDAMQVEKE